MLDILITYTTETWILLNEAAPWVLFGFFVAALIKVFISDQFIAKHLGKNGATSVLKASALGVPLPLCSCGVVPAATGLRRQGASKGATAAFMISTPETGADSMAVTWAMLDPVMTVVRPIAAFITATVAGLAINALPDSRALDNNNPSDMTSDCGCGGGCCGSETTTNETSFSHRLKDGFTQTFGEMLQDIGKWLIIGILLAGLISTFVPADFFESYLGNEWASMVVMLVAGIPLYICATSSTPIAATMALKGLSPGAALVFLLAGPATNAATIAVTSKVLGKRATAIYVGAIALCALGIGWLVNRIYFAMGLSVTSWVRASEADHITWWSISASLILLALIVRPLLIRGKSHQHASSCGSGCGCGPQPLKPLSGQNFTVK
ncbi:SO_0444 family Cu/Zn efflux transporter [Desulfovibrio ferrophilus]|uniref:Membrane protein DUF318 n=1 Tax=Desulfovibrio ferrophilus TaxID=241368 RepID=A0A2Z6B0D5_9BACT|nr:SO_0444 family Cu/Zn efflux transporter [Desulfovibrio ferrophilus]BBD08979.1 membrane protein DUF318 [Desulfovibrio ferrophilus]